MKYTFEDWKSGNITLDGTYFTVPKDLPNPIIVYWNSFDTEDQEKIRSTQKEIFSRLCQDEFDLIVNDFSQRYNNSKFKKILIDREIEKLNDLLFSDSSVNETNW